MSMVYSPLVSRFFKLVGKVTFPVPPDEYFQWVTKDPEHGSRTVKLDLFRNNHGPMDELIRVSTVFLMGVNHRWIDGTDPLLFETMVFGGTMDHAQWRYPSWNQAEVGHQKVIEQLLLEMPHLTQVIEEPGPVRTTRYARILKVLCPPLKN